VSVLLLLQFEADATGVPLACQCLQKAFTLQAKSWRGLILRTSMLETSKVERSRPNYIAKRASKKYTGNASATRLLLLQFKADTAGTHRGVHLGEPKFLFARDADLIANLHQLGAVMSPATPQATRPGAGNAVLGHQK
jgi:hypothetical protein